MEFQEVIVKNLLENPEYSKKIIPHLNPKYFDDSIIKNIIHIICNFSLQYKTIPTYTELNSALSNDKKISPNIVEIVFNKIEEIRTAKIETWTIDNLVDSTEHYFQESILQQTIIKAAEILSGADKEHKKHILPDMMRQALKISFKNSIGRELGNEKTTKAQFDYYHNPEHKFPFAEWDTFNNITNGGITKKALIVYVANTNVGKTTLLVNSAIQLIKGGSNVLFVTLEIAEEEVIKRIDANLIDVKTDELILIDEKRYTDKVNSLKASTKGRMIIKEYPPASINVNHIRHLMDELEIKENFKPDFICVDYLNICNSINYKNKSDTYTYVKGISEEFRGLAVDKNIGVLTATQSQRAQAGSSDIDITEISESFGTAHTADFILGIIETDDLKNKEMYLFKVLKSRYAPIMPSTQKFLMGVDKYKQKIYELDDPRKGLVEEDSDVSDQSGNKKNNFSDWKIG